MLRKIRVFGGTLPGSFSILFNGTAFAEFPVGGVPAGQVAYAEYDVQWAPKSAQLQAAIFRFTAASRPAFVELVFGDAGASGIPIKMFRGIEFTRTDGGAVTAAITVNYDEGPATPREFVAFISASAGRFQFPVTGGPQYAHECKLIPTNYGPDPVPDLEATNSLTLTAITDGASTIFGVVYY